MEKQPPTSIEREIGLILPLKVSSMPHNNYLIGDYQSVFRSEVDASSRALFRPFSYKQNEVEKLVD